MKKIVYTALIVFLITTGCGKDKTKFLNSSAQNINPNDPASVANTLGYGYDGLIYISASNGAAEPGVSCHAVFYDSANSSVSVDSLILNSENVPKDGNNIYNLANRYYSSSGSYNVVSTVQSFMGNDLNIHISGNSTNGYSAYDTVAGMPSFISGTNFTTLSSRQITSSSSIALTWTGGSSSDEYAYLEIKWLEKGVAKGSGYISHYGEWVDDDGNFTIPNSVVTQFDPSGNIEITLHRYRAYMFDVSGRSVAVLGHTSYLYGGFYY